jgi:lipid II:glycine glycyltransferase (peptidoglycan interpeptide bridge formation enzyme)
MLNSEQWNAIIAALPGAHILQTWEWGKVKSLFGWQAHFLVWFQKQGGVELVTDRHLDHLKKRPVAAAALALQRNISVGGFSHRMGVMYLPKGPLLDWNDTWVVKQVLNDVSVFGEKHGAIFIKIDPDIEVGSGIPGSEEANESSLGAQITQKLKSDGWQFSGEQVQFRNTVVIDLTPSQDELLANMKQKTRYNINLAMRKGVSVRLGNQADLGMLFRMYAETSVRDGFVIRNESYYKEVWSTFLPEQRPTTFDSPQAEVLIAEVEGAPIAGIFIFRFAGRAWYLYVMSSQMHRDKMPNYLLQCKPSNALKLPIASLMTYGELLINSLNLIRCGVCIGSRKGSVERSIATWELGTFR